MEETSQQENIQAVDIRSQNEDEGGIRRRLRDRELLRKRKAEAEEKETNQVESQHKRSRPESKSGTKRRGRPRKIDPALQLPDVEEEAGDPARVILGQPLSSQTAIAAVGSQQAASVPALQMLRNSVFESSDVDSAPVLVQDPAQAAPEPVQAPFAAPDPVPVPFVAPVPVQASYAVPIPVQASYAVPIPVQAPTDVPVQLQVPDDLTVEALAPDDVSMPVQFPDSVSVQAPSPELDPAAALAPPPAPPQVETLYTESPDGESLDRVLIEELDPEDEGEIPPSQNNGSDGGFDDETPLMKTAERNKMYSVPTLSSPPLPQEYLPGNQL